MTQKAKIAFDRDHELIDLAGQMAAQPANLTDHYPSIAPPASTDWASLLCSLLQGEGGLWIAVNPVGSDLPMVGIYDGMKLRRPDRPELDQDFLQGLVEVGHEPVFISEKIARPLIVPPLARYFYGDVDAAALRSVGGEGDAGLIDSLGAAYVSDYFSFRVALKFSREKWSLNDPMAPYQFRLKKGIYTPGTGVVVYNAYSALFIKQQGAIWIESSVPTAAGGNVVSKMIISDDGNVNYNSQEISVVTFMQWLLQWSCGKRYLLNHVLTDAVAGPASLKQYHGNSSLIGGSPALDGF